MVSKIIKISKETITSIKCGLLDALTPRVSNSFAFVTENGERKVKIDRVRMGVSILAYTAFCYLIISNIPHEFLDVLKNSFKIYLKKWFS